MTFRYLVEDEIPRTLASARIHLIRLVQAQIPSIPASTKTPPRGGKLCTGSVRKVYLRVHPSRLGHHGVKIGQRPRYDLLRSMLTDVGNRTEVSDFSSLVRCQQHVDAQIGNSNGDLDLPLALSYA